MASFQAKPRWERPRMRLKKKKIIILIHSNPTRNREFQQNRKKKWKKLENIIMPSFQAKIGRDRLWVTKKKVIVPIHSNLTRNW